VATTDLEAQAIRSRVQWRALGLRIQSVTPSQLARAALVLLAISTMYWVTSTAWSQLLPFQLGLVLAYITLPFVNWLDGFMPRWLAASFLVVLEFGGIVAATALLVPPLIQEVSALVNALPDLSEIQTMLVRLRSALQSLPPPVQDLVRNGVEQVAANARANALTYLQTVGLLALATVSGLFGTLGFVVGFLGIPTWLVSVMSDQKAGARAINQVLPLEAQPDFWAVVRIADRTFSAFVRGQLLYGLATACLLYFGFVVLDRLNISSGDFRLLLAIFAGLTQLIPAIGPILGAIPAVAAGLVEGPQAALGTLAMYVIAQFLLSAFLAPLVADRYVDIHPAIFVIILVLMSQFGFVWLLVAAPLSIVIRDLFRYVYGRLGDPPQPAGVVPGDRVRRPAHAAVSMRPARG
jgi:predicted PurR-regulated permease PerM